MIEQADMVTYFFSSFAIRQQKPVPIPLGFDLHECCSWG